MFSMMLLVNKNENQANWLPPCDPSLLLCNCPAIHHQKVEIIPSMSASTATKVDQEVDDATALLVANGEDDTDKPDGKTNAPAQNKV